MVPIIEPPKPPYDPAITARKGWNSGLVSALIAGAVSVVVTLTTDKEFMSSLPLWASPLITAATAALINWWKNHDNPPESQYATPPLAR